MSQQINLLNPALIQKTDFLNANNIALLLGVLLLSFFAYYQYESNALEKMSIQEAQLAKQAKDMEAEITHIRAAKAAQNGNQVLLETINTLEKQIMQQEAIIKAVSQKNNQPSNSQPSKSYAALLKAFSKQSINGLWITGLSIDQDAEALSIKGRALHADLLPALIARLRAEPALKGKTFTDLKMQSASLAPVATSPTAATTNGKTENMTNKAATQAEPPAFIEFTLNSVTDKTANKPNLQETAELAGAAH